ncbi:MAG: ParB/RepB/Spo0J family partition protein [Syntrophales bacterium]
MTKPKSSPPYTKGSLYSIPCDVLKTDPNQPRKYFDIEALKALADSIKIQGVLQPVLFRQDTDDILFIVAGERRLQATKAAGLKTIPAIFVDGNFDEIALVENLLRQDLTAIETAEALNRIQKEHDYSNDQLTGIIGKAKSTVSEILSLNKLPEEIRNECRDDASISRKFLLSLLKQEKEKSMLTVFNKFKERRNLPEKTRGPKKGTRRSWQDKFLSRYDALTTFVGKMKLEKLDITERTDLIARIDELKKKADALIEQIKETPEALPKEKKAPVKKTTKTTKPAIRPVPKKPATTEKKKAVSGGKK